MIVEHASGSHGGPPHEAMKSNKGVFGVLQNTKGEQHMVGHDSNRQLPSHHSLLPPPSSTRPILQRLFVQHLFGLNQVHQWRFSHAYDGLTSSSSVSSSSSSAS